MKRRKIMVVVMLISMMITTVLGGCSSKGNENNDSKSAELESSQTIESSSVTANSEKLELSIWLTPQWRGVFGPDEEGADYDSFFKYAGERFTKEIDPNVTINVQVIPGEQRPEKLNTCVQTKTLPDMFFDSSFTMLDYVHRGVLEPIDDIISEESKKDIAEGIWENVTINDKVYFYPFNHMPGTLCYNADLFKKAGLDEYIGEQYEIVTWTPEEFEHILKTLKENVENVYPVAMFCKNFAGDTWNLAWLRMYGSQFFDKDGNLIINEESGVRALTYMLDLSKQGLVTPGVESLTSNDALAMFANQSVAISVTNSVLFGNALGDMKSGAAPTFDARLANVPGDPTPNTFTYVSGGMVFNTGNTAKMEASKKFIKFLSEDPELVIASKNGLPVRESILPKVKGELPYLEAYNKNAENMFSFSGGVPGYNELRNALFPELQAAFIGEKTAQEALDSYVNTGEGIIEKNRSASVLY